MLIIPLWGGDSFGYLDGGLYDIFGSFFTECSSNHSISCAFAYTKSISNNAGATGGSADNYITFYASRYNSIYGNSDTVQPPAIKVRVKTRYI